MIASDALAAGCEVARRFRIEKVIGYGHGSAVYQAFDLESETRVALKILDPTMSGDPIAAERFAREAEILRRLDHPNIIKLFALIEDGGQSMICMEYFHGSDCKAFTEKYGPMSMREFLPIAQTLSAAVAACHRGGVLHRDLKPQNVLINSRQEIKIVDFGISKMSSLPELTRTGTVLGTPQYMAPEMFRSSRADPRSDIYGVGAVFYELLTGRPPYSATTLPAVMSAQLRGDIEPIGSSRTDVPHWLESIVFKCLKTDPGRRYQSCAELIRDLRRGERALAAYEEKHEPVRCLHCNVEVLPGLPFCQDCGVFQKIEHRRGRHMVVLQRCDEPDRMRAYLQRAFTVSSVRALRRQSRLPAVLFKGISRQTAAGLVHQLSVLPCELRIAEQMVTRLELPLVYAGLGFLLLLPLFRWADVFSPMMRAAVIIAAELGIVLLYRAQTRPIARLKSDSPGTPTDRDQALLEIVAGLKRVSDSNLKTILGHVIRSFLSARERLRRSASILPIEAIAKAVLRAIEAAPAIEAHEQYLSKTSLTDIRAKLQALNVQLSHASESGRLERLIDVKSTLQRELRNYVAIQDLHADLYLALLNLQGVLERINDMLDAHATPADLVRDLHCIENDLAVSQGAVGGGALAAATGA